MTPMIRNLLSGGGLIKNGLAALYDFQQGVNAQVLYDKSGNNYNGQLGTAADGDTNDPSWSAEGLVFGADDVVIGPTALDVGSGSNDFTIIFVGNPDPAAGASRAWIGKNVLSVAGSWGLYQNTTDKMQFQIRDGVAQNIATHPIAFTGNPQFFVGRRRAMVMSCFLGLTQGTSVASTAAPATATATFTLGRRPHVEDQYYSRTMYYALCYNRALSDAEIKRTYNYMKKQLAKRGVVLG